MFEQENKFYEENKDNLRKQYLGKEVVIVEDKVIAAYDDVGTAIRETVKTRPLGSFCVKNVPESPEEKVIRIPTISFVIPPLGKRLDRKKSLTDKSF